MNIYTNDSITFESPFQLCSVLRTNYTFLQFVSHIRQPGTHEVLAKFRHDTLSNMPKEHCVCGSVA